MSEQHIDGLFTLVHGESGVGKSWLGYSSPKPVLILDAEGRTKFLRGKKVLWDPRKDPPPDAGDWEYCVVYTNDWQTLNAAYQWLSSGQHPFVSVVLDSLTELQKKCIDDVAGTEQPDQQDWGAILRYVEDTVRKFRDLTLPSSVKPLHSVLVIALTFQKDGKFRAFVKGQLVTSLPGFVDVVGFYYTEPDPTNPSVLKRRLLIQPHGEFQAKDGTDVLSQHYGLVIDNPNLTEMVQVANGLVPEKESK